MMTSDSQSLRRLSIAAVVILIGNVPIHASAADDAWIAAAIADASRAAPPAVTADATIFGWTGSGELALARYGPGPYTCIASGAFSLRLGKPALPFADPMCLDQNAWSFIQALWSGRKDKPLPMAPGLVWMLAGMNVTKSAVDIGASTIATTSGTADTDVIQMTPHIMIMPLPFDESVAGLTTRYNLENPLDAWIMAAGQPHEHLMVHFSPRDTAAMMGTDQ